MSTTAELTGRWERIAGGGPCSEPYPDRIAFQSGGLYQASSEPARFTLWDVGTYEVTGPNRVKLSTANDAVVAYEFAIAGDSLTFIAPDACRIGYRKLP